MDRSIRFEWDGAKDAANLRKHGVGFDEAATIFLDEQALLLADPEHSDSEDRFLLMGASSSLRVLVVCHCYRGEDSVIRIISARKASPSERAMYVARLGG